MIPHGGRRFWLFYGAAWVPYLGVYATAFLLSGEMPPGPGFIVALNAVLPSAVVGIGVVWLCSRVEWRTASVVRFLGIHLGGVVVYAVLVGLAEFGIYTATWPIVGKHFPESASIAAMLPWHFFMSLMIYTILGSLTYAFRSTTRLREEEHRAARAEGLRARAELQALRAQLNPHFLFNTLHSLIALVRKDSEAAEDAIEQFADLLRYASRVHQETRDEVTFGEEWEFVQNYLALESLRIGDRLRVHAAIEDATLESVAPAFCLQPLVENAIRHAVAPRAGGGTIWIGAGLAHGELRLEVRDDGPGADPAAVRSNGRMGLKLVRQRVEALYGDRGRFEFETAPGQGFIVRLSFPARHQFTTPPGIRVWSAP